MRKSHYPRPSSLLGFAIAAGLLISGCGYHFAASGDALPQGAQTIYVSRFGNSTRVTGINDELMRYIKDEIAMHRRLKVVSSRDMALADYLNRFAAIGVHEILISPLSSEPLAKFIDRFDAEVRPKLV